MTLFAFDANTGKTDWRSVFPDPDDFAQHVWSELTVEPVLSSIEEACEWAKVDRETYNALWAWTVERKEELNTEARLLIFDALLRETPKKNNKHDLSRRRDIRLFIIAKVLLDEDEYGLNAGQNDSTEGVVNVGSVLRKLPGVTVTGKHITKIIRRAQNGV